MRNSIKLILLLYPIITFSQFDQISFLSINKVLISDDLYIEPNQLANIVATSKYGEKIKDYYGSYFIEAKIIDSFESNSDLDAVIESNWKSDYILRPGVNRRDALVKGENNKYYIVRFKK